MRLRSPATALAGLALAALAAVPALAAPRVILAGNPGEVRGGEELVIRWSGLDADVEEVELELSIEGARWVRISPELESLEGRFRWRVPRGLAGSARIRLRAGDEHGEREVATCAFEFVHREAARPGGSLATPGWWDLDAAHGALPSGITPAHRVELGPGGACAGAVPASTTHAGRDARGVHRDARPVPHVRPASAGPLAFHATRHAPLRI